MRTILHILWTLNFLVLNKCQIQNSARGFVVHGRTALTVVIA